MFGVHGEDYAGNPLIFDALGVDLTAKLAFYTADVGFGAYYFDDQGVAVNILPGTPGPVMIKLNPDYIQWKQGDRSLGYFPLPEDHERIAHVEVRKIFLFDLLDALYIPAEYGNR